MRTLKDQDPSRPAIGEVVALLDQLVDLLNQHGESGRAAWLSERRSVLQDSAAMPDVIDGTFEDLHGIVSGMGGLLDVHLRAGDRSAVVNASLYEMADRLYELTRES